MTVAYALAVDFGLTDEQRMILDTTREFVRRELVPLEGEVSRAEMRGETSGSADRPSAATEGETAGLWGLMTPEEYGGANVGVLMTALINVETARALVRFNYGGSADNILYGCNEEQKQRYLLPVIAGERQSCFALTEPTRARTRPISRCARSWTARTGY